MWKKVEKYIQYLKNIGWLDKTTCGNANWIGNEALTVPESRLEGNRTGRLALKDGKPNRGEQLQTAEPRVYAGQAAPVLRFFIQRQNERLIRSGCPG